MFMYTYIIYVNLCPKDDFISDGYSVRIQDGASYLFVSYNFVPYSLCHHFSPFLGRYALPYSFENISVVLYGF